MFDALVFVQVVNYDNDNCSSHKNMLYICTPEDDVVADCLAKSGAGLKSFQSFFGNEMLHYMS